jgi:hypothetical protein
MSVQASTAALTYRPGIVLREVRSPPGLRRRERRPGHGLRGTGRCAADGAAAAGERQQGLPSRSAATRAPIARAGCPADARRDRPGAPAWRAAGSRGDRDPRACRGRRARGAELFDMRAAPLLTAKKPSSTSTQPGWLRPLVRRSARIRTRLALVLLRPLRSAVPRRSFRPIEGPPRSLTEDALLFLSRPNDRRRDRPKP